MTNPARRTDPMKITLSDMLGRSKMKLSDVPTPPENSVVFCDDNEDTLYIAGDKRWRYRDGILIGYIQYREAGPVLLYGGDY